MEQQTTEGELKMFDFYEDSEQEDFDKAEQDFDRISKDFSLFDTEELDLSDFNENVKW